MYDRELLKGKELDTQILAILSIADAALTFNAAQNQLHVLGSHGFMRAVTIPKKSMGCHMKTRIHCYVLSLQW